MTPLRSFRHSTVVPLYGFGFTLCRSPRRAFAAWASAMFDLRDADQDALRDSHAFASFYMVSSTEHAKRQLGGRNAHHVLVYLCEGADLSTPVGVSALMHELGHATINMLRQVDLPLQQASEEAYTYLLGHLAEWAWSVAGPPAARRRHVA